MNAFEELQNKPRENRTLLENCIVDAATLEDAERDGETEPMENAAKVLFSVYEALKKAKSVFDAAYVDEDLRLAEKYIDMAIVALAAE